MTIEHSINLQISNFNLPVIHITNISPEKKQKNIKEKIQEICYFLKNKPVVINVETLTYKNNWDELYQSILDTKLYVIGVCSCHDKKLKKIILKSGLPILKKNEIKKYQNNQNFTIQTKIKYLKKEKTHNTQLVEKPVRSGQQIYARNSDLIIINNVSPGAEIIADGNIHIYGIMRGRILAGASGNKQCQIFCSQFFPELVSIDGRYWIGDQVPKQFIGKSVRLNLQNNILAIHFLQ